MTKAERINLEATLATILGISSPEQHLIDLLLRTFGEKE